MFLSIILPIYNVENFLPECLDSLYKQDISESEYEVICVNDGSPDSCESILKAYSAKHGNMVIINQENAGVSAARNAGIKAAKGDYIWFVDPDDVVVPNYLFLLQKKLYNNPVDELIFRIYQFNMLLTTQEKEDADSHKLKCNNYGSGIWARLIKRTLVVKNELLFNTSLTVGEDTVFLVQLDEYVETVGTTEDVIYLYRQHSSSVMHKHNEDLRIKKLASHIAAAELTYNIYQKQAAKKQTTANAVMFFVWISLIDIAAHRDSISSRYLQIMREKHLFPIKRLPECNSRTAYATCRKDLIGRLYNYLTTHSNRSLGLALLKMWYSVAAIRNRH